VEKQQAVTRPVPPRILELAARMPNPVTNHPTLISLLQPAPERDKKEISIARKVGQIIALPQMAQPNDMRQQALTSDMVRHPDAGLC
jgi:hypothetical protein